MRRIILVSVFVSLCSVLCGQTYHIGDVFTAPDGSMGIVYYLFPDGSGGWVVALNDASSGCAWGDATDVPGLDNQNNSNDCQQLLFDTAGYTHTQVLRAYQNNSSYAAGVVNFANGWVLPSPGQLRMLYARQPLISTALSNAGGSAMASSSYWTSAEYSSSYAWAYHFETNSTSGGAVSYSKSSSYRVRAVYVFSISPFTYQWSDGSTTPSITVSPAQTTTYSVTVSANEYGCGGEGEQQIVVNSGAVTSITTVGCDYYDWDGQVYTESGSYTRTYPLPNGCDSVVNLELTIEVNPDVSMQYSADTICFGDTVDLQAVVANYTDVSYIPHIAIGDILCTDNSIVKPSDWPCGKTAKGIVFYVDGTGNHGWAVHLRVQRSGVAWGGYGTNINTMIDYYNARDVITDISGYQNTNRIRNFGNSTIYPAAYAVDFTNGWYIPSAGQLRLLFAEVVTVNASLALVNGSTIPMDAYVWYWSSSEYDGNKAWVGNHSGSIQSVNKDGSNVSSAVRSVISF